MLLAATPIYNMQDASRPLLWPVTEIKHAGVSFSQTPKLSQWMTKTHPLVNDLKVLLLVDDLEALPPVEALWYCYIPWFVSRHWNLKKSDCRPAIAASRAWRPSYFGRSCMWQCDEWTLQNYLQNPPPHLSNLLRENWRCEPTRPKVVEIFS